MCFISTIQLFNGDVYKRQQKYSSTVDFIGDWKGFIKTFLLLPFSFMTYSRLLWHFRQKRVDVVVMSEFSERMLVALLAWVYRIPLVWIEYGRPHDTFKRMFPWSKVIFRLLKDIPARYITPTQYVQKSLMTDGRVSLSKIDVIPCGTAIPRVDKKISRKKPFVIGCISRLAPEKGQRDVIESMPDLLKKHAVQLWIIGTGPDEAYLKESAKRLGVHNHVLFKGFVKENEDVYKDIDCVVFSSTWELEGFGLVLIEAMARGIPVVASSIGPVSEVVGDASLIYEPGDREQLYDHLTHLIEDRTLAHSLASKGRKRVKEKFSIEASAQKMIESFLSLIHISLIHTFHRLMWCFAHPTLLFSKRFHMENEW